MPVPLEASECLDREFLEVRAWLLQIAAALDRIDRSAGSVAADPRRQSLDEAAKLLLAAGPDRAEKIQLLFSLDYDSEWKQSFAFNEPR